MEEEHTNSKKVETQKNTKMKTIGRGLGYEIRQSLKTPQFYIAFGIEMFIVITHFVLSTISQIKLNQTMKVSFLTTDNFSDKYMYMPINIFNAWIAMDSKFYMYLILLISPVIAALPYASSLYTDIKGSMGKNILVRTGKSGFIRNKLIAVFISGGITVTIPILIDLLVCMCFFPYSKPESASFLFPLTPQSSFSNVFYTYPILFCVIELAMIFVFSGLWASIAYICTPYIKYKYTLLIIGMILNLFLGVLAEFIEKYSIAPTAFMAAYYSEPRFLEFIIVSAVFILLIVVESLYMIKRGDLQ